ncbi:hypothetical protein MUG91_G183n37 [Manis pentadactyla]|nr:hypothetical protein MUG91_G183n37 [Manis pentadactyla]
MAWQAGSAPAAGGFDALRPFHQMDTVVTGRAFQPGSIPVKAFPSTLLMWTPCPSLRTSKGQDLFPSLIAEPRAQFPSRGESVPQPRVRIPSWTIVSVVFFVLSEFKRKYYNKVVNQKCRIVVHKRGTESDAKAQQSPAHMVEAVPNNSLTLPRPPQPPGPSAFRGSARPVLGSAPCSSVYSLLLLCARGKAAGSSACLSSRTSHSSLCFFKKTSPVLNDRGIQGVERREQRPWSSSLPVPHGLSPMEQAVASEVGQASETQAPGFVPSQR